jgi:hypothetical protein
MSPTLASGGGPLYERASSGGLAAKSGPSFGSDPVRAKGKKACFSSFFTGFSTI